MKHLKKFHILLLGSLIVLNTFEVDGSDRSLHVPYLGPVNAGGGRGGGFGGSRTNYVYLPGQTLAPEAIYFDHLMSATNLTDAYLKHFDAVVQVMPDAEVGVLQQKLLSDFKGADNALINYSERPTDPVLREAVLGGVGKKAKSEWEASLASRPTPTRLRPPTPKWPPNWARPRTPSPPPFAGSVKNSARCSDRKSLTR